MSKRHPGYDEAEASIAAIISTFDATIPHQMPKT